MVVRGKKIIIILSLLINAAISFAQEFTNKGRDFWLCFPSHVPNQRDGVFFLAKLSLFITSPGASSGKVTIPGSFATNFSVGAGQVTELEIPYNLAYITPAEAATVVQKGIHVQVDSGKTPVVVYSHIYAGFRSAASLVLPVTALGKKYFSINAPQLGIDHSKSQFTVIAVSSNTVIKITPVKDGMPFPSFTVNLSREGDVYELQDDKDLSGSLIESIPSGTDVCKKIAVFSGSSAINISTSQDCMINDSYDPLYQQLYPVNVWGKKYGFIPFANYLNGNPYRILASENNTTVQLNGAVVARINAGEYYPPAASFGTNLLDYPVIIEADKPVAVAQYAQSSACSGAPAIPGRGYGDADMVILNPVEQNVNNITVFSSSKENIYPDSKFINVLLPANDTASFRINNTAPAVTWSLVQPSNSGMACAKIPLQQNLSAFSLHANNAFNAVAYGFGDFESYAYSAGTSVKDLYRAVTVENEFGEADFPASCRDTRFRICVSYPYQTNEIRWKFGGQFPEEVITNPVPAASFIINGVTVYRYKLDNQYSIAQPGSYNFSVVANNPMPDGCAGEDEIQYAFQVMERPSAGFNYATTGCIADAVTLQDASDSIGRKVNSRFWSFGDGQTATAIAPLHTYAIADTFTVQHWLINDIGCISDTAIRSVSVTNIPVAAFDSVSALCMGDAASFHDRSLLTGEGSIKKWNWTFGDGHLQSNDLPAGITYHYPAPGHFTASLQVESSSGCKSPVYTQNIHVKPTPVASFLIPVFCLPQGNRFINTSVINDSSAYQLLATWSFGDGSLTDTAYTPFHTYADTGYYPVTLFVQSLEGCKDTMTKPVTTIHPVEHMQASLPVVSCLLDQENLNINVHTAEGNALSEIFISKAQDSPFLSRIISAGSMGVNEALTYAVPGDQFVKIVGRSVTTGCFSDTLTKNIHVYALPSVSFSYLSPLCSGSPVQFFDSTVVTEGSPVKWTWHYSDGQSSAIQNPVIAFDTGSYETTLVVEDDHGCRSGIFSTKIIVQPSPVADFTFSGICLRDTGARFINRSSIENNGYPLTYKWSFGDPGSHQQDTSFLQHPVHAYSDTGIYNVRLTVMSATGCIADTVKPFVVNGAKPVADFEIDNSQALCNNGNVVLKNKSDVDFGRIQKVTITWDRINEPLVNLTDSNVSINKAYVNRYSDTANGEKNYSIQLIAWSGFTCTDTITKTIQLHALPELIFEKPGKLCAGQAPLNLSSYVSEKNGLPGTGIFNGPGTDAAGFFKPANTGPGSFTLACTFTSFKGCSSSVQQVVEVAKPPSVNAGPDKTINEGQTTSLNGASSQPVFYWNASSTMNNPDILNPVVKPVSNTFYTLTVVSPDGCKATDTVVISVIKKVVVPNAFSPNGDGLNDRWLIPYIDNDKNAVVQVYTRYGQRIFYSEGYRLPWDGTYKGEPLDTGTYAWIIKLSSGDTLKGTVTIIR